MTLFLCPGTARSEEHSAARSEEAPRETTRETRASEPKQEQAEDQPRQSGRTSSATIFGFILGSAKTPDRAREDFSFLGPDARAWQLALEALTPSTQIELLVEDPTRAQLAAAIEKQRLQIAESKRATGKPTLAIVTLLGHGRPAGGSTAFALADQWLGPDDLRFLLARLGADRLLVVADFDNAFRWLWPRATNAPPWVATRELTAAKIGSRPVVALVETRRRKEFAALGGSALSLRARSCLLGLADLNRDHALQTTELTRCVNAPWANSSVSNPAEQTSAPFAYVEPRTPLAQSTLFRWSESGSVSRSESTTVALPAGQGHFIYSGNDEVIAAARSDGPQGATLHFPASVPRRVIELAPPQPPSVALALTPTGKSLLEHPTVPLDLLGMSRAEEEELDTRLRMAGFYDAREAGAENTLWLAGGVTAGAIGLGLLVAEMSFAPTRAFDVAGAGLSPVVVAGGAAAIFGAAMSVGALVTPLFTEAPAQTKSPKAGRTRRRAIAHALNTLREDALWDLRWRWVGGASAAAIGATIGTGAGVLTFLLMTRTLAGGDDQASENSRRLLSLGTGAAAGTSLAFFAVAALLPLSSGYSARLLEALTPGEAAMPSSDAAPNEPRTEASSPPGLSKPQ